MDEGEAKALIEKIENAAGYEGMECACAYFNPDSERAGTVRCNACVMGPTTEDCVKAMLVDIGTQITEGR